MNCVYLLSKSVRFCSFILFTLFLFPALALFAVCLQPAFFFRIRVFFYIFHCYLLLCIEFECPHKGTYRHKTPKMSKRKRDEVKENSNANAKKEEKRKHERQSFMCIGTAYGKCFASHQDICKAYSMYLRFGVGWCICVYCFSIHCNISSFFYPHKNVVLHLYNYYTTSEPRDTRCCEWIAKRKRAERKKDACGKYDFRCYLFSCLSAVHYVQLIKN